MKNIGSYYIAIIGLGVAGSNLAAILGVNTIQL